MELIDELFGQFIHEQENLGRTETAIRRYRQSFRCFRKLIPDVDVGDIDEKIVIEFLDKLRKIKYWNAQNNDFVSIKASTILNSINYLWSFFIWVKKRNYNINDTQNNDNLKPKIQMNKLIFLSLYLKAYNLFPNSKNNNKINAEIISDTNTVSTELLIKQLSRRFNSFFQLNNAVFYKGIADYIKFISEKKRLSHIIKNDILQKEHVVFKEIDELITKIHKESTDQELYSEFNKFGELGQNSVWGSWFNLEVVYLMIFKMRELQSEFKENVSLLKFIKNLFNEMKMILCNCPYIENIHFKRDAYNTDIIRVHNYILEVLEEKNEIHEPEILKQEKISYKFNGFGIPSGELIIKGFKPIHFTKNPAIVIQYYYLNRDNDEYFSYKDFNEFLGERTKHLNSNEFRLLIDSINRRINTKTSGVVKKIIIMRRKETKSRDTNRYRFLNSI